jgi:hypothetical protein
MKRLLFLLVIAELPLLLFGANHVSSVRADDARRVSLTDQTESTKHVILGVLEHYQSGESKGAAVRVTFYEENGQWKAFPTDFDTAQQLSQAVRSFPETVTWTICFDGRVLGSFASKAPPSYSRYADIGEQQITSKSSVPTVGRANTLFSGWPGGQSYRPLVLNSRPYCADSGEWRPEKPQEGEIAAIKDYFGKSFQVSASKLSKARIKVNKSYESHTRGESLISLDVAGIKVIPGDDDNDQNTGAWFYLNGGEVRYIGSNMLLVDVGDYNQDGHEEAVFKIQRYNNDGYMLLYDGFKQKIEFSWTYH